MMESFIRMMPEAQKNYDEYLRIRQMSLAFRSPYKYVEDWFAKEFPYYGQCFVEENGEAKWTVAEMFKKAEEEANAKKN